MRIVFSSSLEKAQDPDAERMCKASGVWANWLIEWPVFKCGRVLFCTTGIVSVVRSAFLTDRVREVFLVRQAEGGRLHFSLEK